MIISFEHEYIFLQTRDTEGNAIKAALAPFCGPMDIITPEISTPIDCAQSESENAQNYLTFGRVFTDADFKDQQSFRTAIRTPQQRAVFYPHATARHVREMLGETIWDRFIKFAVERPPLDRLASRHHLSTNGSRTETASDDVFRELVRSTPCNSQIYSIEGQVAVDGLLAFDTAPQQIAELLTHHGIPFDKGLLLTPRPKAQTNLCFSPDQEDWVKRHYRYPSI